MAVKARDAAKAARPGWDLMLERNPGDGWLVRSFFRNLTDAELHNIAVFPNAACVGVNSGRVRREMRRRLATAIAACEQRNG